ncbi:ribosome recycling factor [Mesoplasma corruscae]|uniref:Ribosome-recycling factor n=1 Tax=Mesoplasma corruscae TaxID=216874 RepID=A0A2S5RHK1_9MOLU|nr:ribosome recycling factor [Mesoplasma corruscae]PPE06781.1 ribosome recycling factor [Mesoplasma corruscae]
MQELINKTEQSMKETISNWQTHIKTIRSGRANASILDRVMVNYYGSLTPIAQTAAITTPEPQMILIKPWDKSLLHEIAAAIVKADLKLNPNEDGDVIRINIPPLTEEIRKDIVKSLNKELENFKIRIRNIRRDAIDTAKKNKDISEDLVRDFEKDIQVVTDKFIKQLEGISKDKEKDIMSL